MQRLRGGLRRDNNPDPAGPTVPMAHDWVPLEHAADCAKELISPERYRTYGGYCNPAEYAAAGPALAEPAVLSACGLAQPRQSDFDLGNA